MFHGVMVVGRGSVFSVVLVLLLGVLLIALALAVRQGVNPGVDTDYW